MALGNFKGDNLWFGHYQEDRRHYPRMADIIQLEAGESSLRTTIQRTNNPGPHYFEFPVYDHALVSLDYMAEDRD